MRDFGTLQYLWDNWTCKPFLIHRCGEKPADKGPWKMVDGCTLLRSEGEEGGSIEEVNPNTVEGVCVLKKDSRLGSNLIQSNCGEEPAEFVSLDSWKAEQKLKVEEYSIELKEGKPGKGIVTFLLQSFPSECGSMRVGVWIDLARVVGAIHGKRKLHVLRHVPRFMWTLLDKNGLHRSHCRKTEHVTKDFSATSQYDSRHTKTMEWSVSIVGIILWLESLAFEGRCGCRDEGKNLLLRQKAKNMLTSILTIPRNGQAKIAFAMTITQCEILLDGMNVDHEVLKQSEAHKNFHTEYRSWKL